MDKVNKKILEIIDVNELEKNKQKICEVIDYINNMERSIVKTDESTMPYFFDRSSIEQSRELGFRHLPEIEELLTIALIDFNEIIYTMQKG